MVVENLHGVGTGSCACQELHRANRDVPAKDCVVTTVACARTCVCHREAGPDTDVHATLAAWHPHARWAGSALAATAALVLLTRGFPTAAAQPGMREEPALLAMPSPEPGRCVWQEPS